ncbi:phage holin family protein [Streptomyces sp. PKU-EA00015]|uniref:phage holin family protein n=1 Tax=Streptomyces sp. PKU-EA00015 TaxID=2748326 RepID=UPI00210B3205|nr:phage holin family protein [Streptomyces sp. PKU-EA00015]
MTERRTSDVQTLFRQEVELAKTEIREEATKAGKAAGMFGGAKTRNGSTSCFGRTCRPSIVRNWYCCSWQMADP